MITSEWWRKPSFEIGGWDDVQLTPDQEYINSCEEEIIYEENQENTIIESALEVQSSWHFLNKSTDVNEPEDFRGASTWFTRIIRLWQNHGLLSPPAVPPLGSAKAPPVI